MALIRANDIYTRNDLQNDPSVALRMKDDPYLLILLPGENQPNDHMGEQDSIVHAAKRHELVCDAQGATLSANVYIDKHDRLVAIDSTVHDASGRPIKQHVRQTAFDRFVHAKQ